MIVIVKFIREDEHYIKFINNLILQYPIYHRFLKPLLNDGDYELTFRLIDDTVYVEVINGIVVEKSINNIISIIDFEKFCYLIKNMAYFMTE